VGPACQSEGGARAGKLCGPSGGGGRGGVSQALGWTWGKEAAREGKIEGDRGPRKTRSAGVDAS
jgi:hypothetical protein